MKMGTILSPWRYDVVRWIAPDTLRDAVQATAAMPSDP
jgi:hypothetical protein